MSSRAYPFPVLEAQEGSAERLARPPFLPRAGSYYVEAMRESDSPAAAISVTHHFCGNNLVSGLLERGQARFGVTVSAPETMFRKFIPLLKFDFVASEGYTAIAPQHAPLNDADIAGTVFVRGSVVVTQDVAVVVDDSCGLMPELSGVRFIYPKGAIIATEEMQAFGLGTISALLKLVKEEDELKAGQIRVVPDAEIGYRFRLLAGNKLYDKLRNADGPYERAHAHSVFIHALSRALEILREEGLRRDKDWWMTYASLRWLSDMIQSLDQTHWDDLGFNADEVATRIRNHYFASAYDESEQ